MRKTLRRIVLISGTTLIFASCTKLSNQPLDEATNFEKYGKKYLDCQPLAFNTSSGHNGSAENFASFKKSINPNTGMPVSIKAGVFSGGVIVDSVELNLIYKNQQVAFVHASRSSDTMLVAELDKKGNLVSVRNGNSPHDQFPPTHFEYRGQQLKKMQVEVNGTFLRSEFLFDNKGNLVRIMDETKNGTAPRVEYQYDMSRKTSGDVYFHEPRRFVWNSFTLAEYAGLLPQLQSKNLRTRATVIWDDDYMAYDYKITNHRMNGNGRLTGYDVIDPVSFELISSHNIDWSCAGPGKNAMQ